MGYISLENLINYLQIWYNWSVEKEVGKDVRHILGEEYDSGGAGIITTVYDYIKLMVALAGKGVGLSLIHISEPTRR